MWLLKPLKGRASEDHGGNQRVNGVPNTAEISKAPLLSSFSMHLGYIELEKSALVWSEILTLFVNTLTAHNKYSRCNVHNFRAKSSNAIISKRKDFLGIFYCISEMWHANLEHFEKKMSILA